jgi:hypothetical protein
MTFKDAKSGLEFPSVTISDRLPTDIGNLKLPTITDGKSVKKSLFRH